ncbi:hypothetical protein [Ascidiimonas aurantiaca]|uniref:hypothetical protein n=1 Tax=Ascidiimonas aurantiaca TaxID=1685432 RepID=UPI0030EEC78E
MKQLSSLGKALNKKAQQEIIAGCPCGNPCDNYNGPIQVTCEQYFNLPPQFQMCVMVSVECFPQ